MDWGQSGVLTFSLSCCLFLNISSTYISRVFIKTEMLLKSRSVLSGSKQLVRSRSSDNLPTSQSQVNIQMMSHTLTIREVRSGILLRVYDVLINAIVWNLSAVQRCPRQSPRSVMFHVCSLSLSPSIFTISGRPLCHANPICVWLLLNICVHQPPPLKTLTAESVRNL